MLGFQRGIIVLEVNGIMGGDVFLALFLLLMVVFSIIFANLGSQ